MNRKGLVWIGILAAAVASPIAISILPGMIESVVTPVLGDDEEPVGNGLIQDVNTSGAIVVEEADPSAAYLSLAKKKALLLNPQELLHEIHVLQKEILELEATRQFNDAVRQLEELVNRHPGSIASQKSKAMLNSLRQINDHGLVDEFGNTISPPANYRKLNKPTPDVELVRPRSRSPQIFDEEDSR